MNPLELVILTALLGRTNSSTEGKIGLTDGSVITQHPDLVGDIFREIPENIWYLCTRANSTYCLHGTFVAGILFAQRNQTHQTLAGIC